MPHLALLGFGCPLWAGAAANAPQFKARPSLGAKKSLGRHAGCPKWAKNRQNGSCASAQGASHWKSVARGLGLQKLLAHVLGVPWARPNHQKHCCKLQCQATPTPLDLRIFLGWAAFHGNFLLWAASMLPCQCACPHNWVRPKVCSLGWWPHPKTAPKSRFWPLAHGPRNGKPRCHCS